MMAIKGQDFYAEVTIDGKYNFVDHVTGRIIENAAISDVYPIFEQEKKIETDKVVEPVKVVETIPE